MDHEAHERQRQWEADLWWAVEYSDWRETEKLLGKSWAKLDAGLVRHGKLLLGVAARSGHMATLDALLRVADVQASGRYGTTALMEAMANNRIEAARRLLDAGADPNATDQEGRTALHYGSGASVSAMELLLAHGAKLDMRARSGHTALDEAITYGNDMVARLLIRVGVPVNASGEYDEKRPAIARAARAGLEDVVAHLIPHGHLDDADDDGMTAIMFAAAGGYATIVERLVEAGARMDLAQANGMTAEDLAREAGHDTLAIWLRREGLKGMAKGPGNSKSKARM